MMLGATGTIGRATDRALTRRGHDVVCFVRPRKGVGGALSPDDGANLFAGDAVRVGDVTDANSLARDAFAGERFDALVSCTASRTGAPKDAWGATPATGATTLCDFYDELVRGAVAPQTRRPRGILGRRLPIPESP
jgi:divinyl chlorophyllide a 8-vinyl-reductase